MPLILGGKRNVTNSSGNTMLEDIVFVRVGMSLWSISRFSGRGVDQLVISNVFTGVSGIGS